MQPTQNQVYQQRRYDALVRNHQRRFTGPQPSASSGPQISSLGTSSGDTLLFVFLRGGMDGLSLLPPIGDSGYAGLRPTLAIPQPGQTGGAIALQGIFGLHPSASALMPAYNANDLAFVHTAGSTDPSLSHFDAMKILEGGYPNQPAPSAAHATGWLGRHLTDTTSTANIRGIVMESTISLSAVGAPKTLPLSNPDDFGIGGYSSTLALRRTVLELVYARSMPMLAGPAASTFSAIDEIEPIDFENYAPTNGATYPTQSYFATRMSNAAALIKADIGLDFVEVDYGGWDDHESQGANGGSFSDRVSDLADTLGAFYQDLGSIMNRVTVVIMSEFGRRVEENGSQGTDHGRGGVMALMGKNVNGGQVFHDWQGLQPSNLDNGSLPVRIDYRNVLGEVLTQRMGNTQLGSVFPNFTPNFINVVS